MGECRRGRVIKDDALSSTHFVVDIDVSSATSSQATFVSAVRLNYTGDC